MMRRMRFARLTASYNLTFFFGMHNAPYNIIASGYAGLGFFSCV